MRLSREILNNEFTSHLDFVHVNNAQIKSLFYLPQHHNSVSINDAGEILYPPLEYRRTAQKIREWFRLGLKNKEAVLAKADEFQWELNTDGVVKYINSWLASDGVQEADATDDASVRSDDAVVNFEPNPAEGSDCEEEEEVLCMGIHLEYINNMKLDSEKRAARIRGFKDVCREGFGTRIDLEHPDNIGFKWPFCIPVVGALTSGNEKGKFVWRLEEQGDYKNTLPSEDGPEFERFSIRHVDCTSGPIQREGLCISCISKKKLLMARIDAAVKARSDALNPKTRISLSITGSLQKRHTEYYRRKSRNLQKKLSYKQRAVVSGNMFVGKRGRSNTAGAAVDAKELIAPLPRVKKQKRK